MLSTRFAGEFIKLFDSIFTIINNSRGRFRIDEKFILTDQVNIYADWFI